MIADARVLSAFHRLTTGTFTNALEGTGGGRGFFARSFRGRGLRGRRQATEQIGLGAAGGESETDAACGFDDAGCDLDQPQPQGRELGVGEIARFGDGVANGEHEPIGRCVQNEADLVADGGNGRRFDRKRAASCAA